MPVLMEEAITAKLLANAALVAIVGDNIAWDHTPQEDILPAVTLKVVSGAPLYSDEGSAGLRDLRVQIDCWAKNTATQSGSTLAKQVARLVIGSLAEVSMTVGGAYFPGVFLDNMQDLDEQGVGGVVIYRRSLEFNLWHLE